VNEFGIGAQITAIPSATKNSALRLRERGVTSSRGLLSGALMLKNSTKSAMGKNPRMKSIAMLT
jgi:hypothetical protein